MQEWLRNQNIAKFEKLLAETTDPDQRRILLQLLAAAKVNAPSSRVREDHLQASGDGQIPRSSKADSSPGKTGPS